jgi:hypothetical protein
MDLDMIGYVWMHTGVMERKELKKGVGDERRGKRRGRSGCEEEGKKRAVVVRRRRGE